MRKCTLLASSAAALVLSLAACGQSNTKQLDATPPPNNTAASSTATPSTTSPAPSKAAPEEFAPLTLNDFKWIGYSLVRGSADKWEAKESTGMPILTGKVGDMNVTDFTIKGITCRVTLYGIQATPGRVSLMATVAQMGKGGLKAGTFDYVDGATVIGRYDCK